MKTNKSGISLIVLIITIIVMIILASAIIITLSENGIIGKANTAVEDMNDAQLKEAITLAWSDAQLKITADEKTDDWYYSTILQYLKDNGYTGDVTDAIIETTGIVPSPSLLKDKYEYYYNSLSSAIADVNAGTVGTNSNADKDTAVAGIYVENGQNTVALFKDTTESMITITQDVTLNLGGCTLTSNDNDGALYVDDADANVIIDGRVKGSMILNNTDITAFVVRLRTGEVTIKGGTYLTTTNGDTGISCVIQSAGKLNVENATLKAEASGIATKARGISTVAGATTNVTDSVITATAKSGVAICFYNAETTAASLVNCNIKAYSDYGNLNDARVLSQGIDNYGEMYLENCYVFGTHTGVQTEGNIVINKGTYEGYYAGGLLLCGEVTHYIQNATVKWRAIPDDYECLAGGASLACGMLISGGSENASTKAYMDNCDISAKIYGIQLNNVYGNKPQTLYISNSKINVSEGVYIRIGEGLDHKVYIGTGCNFTAANTNLPDAVTVTTETYTKP